MNTRHLSALTLAIAAPLHADVTLPALFSDQMVLQQGVDLPVWGWADAGDEVTVQLGDATRSSTPGTAGK